MARRRKLIGQNFDLGELMVMPGAQREIDATETLMLIGRHLRGDWAALSEEDRAANETAVKQGGRILSEFYSRSGQRIIVITEADRKATIILLPEEYPTE